ncbi:MAG: alpha/beta hydrolase [Pseudomonadota bacterium]
MDLDDAYQNAAHIPDGDSFPDRWADAARAHREVEASIGRARLNTPYGAAERERLDLFHPAGRAEGLVVFFHGGYWISMDRSYWSHLAAGATARGWAVAVPSYPLAPEVVVPEITRATARAVEVAAAFVNGPIVAVGHSAGGHLAARLANPDSQLAPDIATRIVRILPISPVADLRPLLRTSMNAELGLTDATAERESPALLPRVLDADVRVWVGADERPAFLEQARALSTAWSVPLSVEPGRHHFDVIDSLSEPDGGLTRALLDGIKGPVF